MIRKKLLNTLLALAILAAFWGSFTYYEKRKSHEPAKVDSNPQEKLFALESSHVQSFTLKPRGSDPFTLRREGGNWTITGPKKLPADQTAVTALLNTLSNANVEEVVDPKPASLRDFGLDPPGHTFELQTDAKPATFTLLLGDETPTSGGLYAQVAGNPRVVTLASYVKSSLEKTLFDLRDKRALTLDIDHLQKIEVSSKDKRWTLVKNPEGVWDLLLPPPARADHFTVDAIVNQFRNLSMLAVVAEDKKKSASYGFGSPTLTAKLTGPEGTQSLVLGKKDGENYDAMNSTLDPVFTLSSSLLAQLQKDPADLRDKELFSFSALDANRLEVDTPKGHRVFELQKDKDKKKWKQTAPVSRDVPTDKVEALVRNIRDLRAASFPKGENLAGFGLTKPAYKFQVRYGEKNQSEAVEASKTGDHVYARRSTDPLACELAKTALDDIEKALGEL